MDMTGTLNRLSPTCWRMEPQGDMRVPVVIYGDEGLVRAMDRKVAEQAANVARLPGIVNAMYAMPDAHWGYGFPVGGVAAFDPDAGGVVSAGGVGFDISCGVRSLLTGLTANDVEPVKTRLADALYENIPVGLGSTGRIRLDDRAMDAMLAGGAGWAVEEGYGLDADLERIEENGTMHGAQPREVSAHARKRQQKEMGTLGSGNHYLEVQRVAQVTDGDTADAFGLKENDVIISIHCGSRGLGHQIGTEFLKSMVSAAGRYGLVLPDRELACAPIRSPLGESYLGAMRSAINCALANRQIITHLTREVFATILPRGDLKLLYDVSHNTCKVEEHRIAAREDAGPPGCKVEENRMNGTRRALYVHRKGATRAFGPGHPDLPTAFRDTGQPVLIGGSMGTASHILAGNPGSERLSFSSACHGAGRSMSRRQASKNWRGRQVIDDLAGRGIIIRSPSARGVAEEAPGAYKDVDAVVLATEKAGLARRVARLEPMVCIKG